MERAFRDKLTRRLGGGLKDRPVCEHCGRPVRLSSDDYEREEVLCVTCADEARTSSVEEYEFSAR